jgi:hypothetical protein
MLKGDNARGNASCKAITRFDCWPLSAMAMLRQLTFSLDERRVDDNLQFALTKNNNPNRAAMWVALFCFLLKCGVFSIAREKAHSCPAPEVVKDKKYQPGQVWQYKTRPDEQGSRITVLKVEALPKVGTIVHVRVDHIRLRNCTGGPEPDTFQHMPFAREAMERSIAKLEKNDVNIPDLGGYEQWRVDCGGVYTITVAEAIKVAEYTFNKGLGCELPDENSTKTPP